MSKITVREAAILAGKSRETINNATKDGTLSFTKNHRGIKVIDVAELERVYPLEKKIEDLEKQNTVRPSKLSSDSDSQEWIERYKLLEARLELSEKERSILETERNRERKQFESQIENLQESLKTSQQTAQKITYLLEDKNRDNKESNWEKSVKALGQRITNQEKVAQEEKIRSQKILKQNRALKQALDAERNKSFWKILFRLS